MAKTSAVLERTTEEADYDFPTAPVLTDTGVRYEANIMGTGELGYSYHIKGTGFLSDADADAFLRRQSESWEEQGVTVRSQDKKYGGAAGAPKAAPSGNSFRPQQGAPAGGGAAVTCEGCGEKTVGSWTTPDGVFKSSAQMADSQRRKHADKLALCRECHAAAKRRGERF